MQPYFTSNGLVTKALEHAFKLEHIMDLTRLRCLGSLFSMLHQACRNVAQYNANHPDFPMQIDQLERYIQVTSFLLGERVASSILSLSLSHPLLHLLAHGLCAPSGIMLGFCDFTDQFLILHSDT